MKKGLTIAIIDDEMDARELAKIHLQRHPSLQLVGEAVDGLEALALLAQKQPELVLLDIQMPEKNGLEVLQASSYLPQVIFTTAYDHFAIKAFELNAVDYLLKPFTAARFDMAIQRAQQRVDTPLSTEILSRLFAQLKEPNTPATLRRIPYRSGSSTEYIPIESIIYIRAADQYMEIHTDDQKYLIRQSMDALEKQLPPDRFFRTHRSAIVALPSVKAIEQDEFRHFEVLLFNGKKVPLSQVRKVLLVAKLQG